MTAGRSTVQLNAFLVDYRPRWREQPLSPAEHELAHELLVDFVIGEQWSGGGAVLDGVLDELATLEALASSRQARTAAAASALIERAVRGLLARLDRQDEAERIMHDELIMLSDRLCRLRAGQADALAAPATTTSEAP